MVIRNLISNIAACILEGRVLDCCTAVSRTSISFCVDAEHVKLMQFERLVVRRSDLWTIVELFRLGMDLLSRILMLEEACTAFSIAFRALDPATTRPSSRRGIGLT
jgi:hypothetical protein